jgi:hypothetical protein
VSDAALVGNLGAQIAAQIHSVDGTAAEPVLGSLLGSLLGQTLRTATQGFLWTGLVGLGVCVALIGLRRLGRPAGDDEI